MRVRIAYLRDEPTVCARFRVSQGLFSEIASCDDGALPHARSIRWIAPPPIADEPAIRRGLALVSSDATTPRDEEWTPIPASGGRFVLRRVHGEGADYLKWFPAARFSIRKRSSPFWPTPAQRHCEWADHLSALGVRLSPLIAAGEWPDEQPLLGQPASFIVTRSPIIARSVRDAAAESMLTPAQRERLAGEVRSIAQRLHAHGIGRLDLRAPNVLIYSPDEPPVLFDIDRFVRLGWFGRRARIEKDLSRVRATFELLLQGRPS